MFSVAVLLAMTCTACAFDSEFFRMLNDEQSLWKSGPNNITARGIEYVKRLLGTRLDKKPYLQVRYDARMLNEYIPDFFDAREQWPECKTISSIKDQSDCGSCWAVAAASVFSDRLCILSEGEIDINMSAENLLSCCAYCGQGCDGGYPDMAWKYIKTHGIVSGGDYGSHEGCQPYEISPCSNTGGEGLRHCGHEIPTPRCHFQCTNRNYKSTYRRDIKKAANVYVLPDNPVSIQNDILENGPVEAAMVVYEDFVSYQSGIYQHTGGEEMGGHAIRIIGWGSENGIVYWLVANSWTQSWGENGLFRIRRGYNECGIESYITGGNWWTA